MNQLHSKSVVVGVDGSPAAIGAAKWAIDEAISRDLPLRVVHVIPRTAESRGSVHTAEWEMESGERVLSQADGALRGTGKPVDVETALLAGDPEQVLIDESHDAALVCLGATEREWADNLLGPTAAAVATRARCPVAIIRSSPDDPLPEGGVIAVVLNDEPDNDDVVHHAMAEGRLRNIPVRLIDRRLNSWVRRYPDVHVEIVAAGTGVKPRENRDKTIELAVLGQADADEIATLGVPNGHPIAGYPHCSVLLVRR
jgi:nucleotide-binding universal stress UspA family protein